MYTATATAAGRVGPTIFRKSIIRPWENGKVFERIRRPGPPKACAPRILAAMVSLVGHPSPSVQATAAILTVNGTFKMKTEIHSGEKDLQAS
jgi:hypothetical protein